MTQVTGQAGYIQQQQQQVPSHPVLPQQVTSQQVSADFVLPLDYFFPPTAEELVQYTVKPQSIVFKGLMGGKQIRKMTCGETNKCVRKVRKHQKLKFHILH
jgi:hypothetical protein